MESKQINTSLKNKIISLLEVLVVPTGIKNEFYNKTYYYDVDHVISCYSQEVPLVQLVLLYQEALSLPVLINRKKVFML